MAKDRRDPRREKTLDMRRMEGDRLRNIFRKTHPWCDWRKIPKGLSWEERRLIWQAFDRVEDEWLEAATNGRPWRRWCWGAPPAWFRRGLNKLRRARDRQTLREQLRDGDHDEVSMPRHRRNARWLWW